MEWLKRLKIRLGLKIGFKYIRCETPEDILVIERRDADPREWEITMEELAKMISICGHAHYVMYVPDAEFRRINGKEKGR